MTILERLNPLRKIRWEGDVPSAGSLYRQSLSIAWPAALEGALVSIIGSVDTMMVGSLGYAAIAAVGIAAQPRMLLLVLDVSFS